MKTRNDGSKCLVLCCSVLGVAVASAQSFGAETTTESVVTAAPVPGAELFTQRWEFRPDDESVGTSDAAMGEVEQFQRADQQWGARFAESRRKREEASVDDPEVDGFIADMAGDFFLPGTHLLGKRGDGLGPLYNATSCADCHPGGGASGVEHNVTLLTIDPRSEALSAASAEFGDELLHVFPTLLDTSGSLRIELVIHDYSTLPGYDVLRNRLVDFVPEGIDEVWFMPERRTSKAIADRPVVAGRHAHVDFYLSQRNAPALFGIGLIEKISFLRLQRLATDQTRRSGGEVTGRLVGKFGWRGQIQSVANFVSLACANELGLTQEVALQPMDPANPQHAARGLDISETDVRRLAHFVSDFPTPIEAEVAGYSFLETDDGETLFNQIGCAVCHVPDIHPVMGMFSDLLVHDMGAELQAPSPTGLSVGTRQMRLPVYPTKGPGTSSASPPYYGPSGGTLPAPQAAERPKVPRFPRDNLQDDELVEGSWDAMQREWRTPPLWGVASTAPYLHDGRAETLEEAILWHGGEAKGTRDRFAALSRDEKDLVIAFLSTLQAPAAETEPR